MPRSLARISLALLVLLSGDVWALGLGEIRLDSALNEPLRAEIELISATPEELANLDVGLASSETFARYGLERPFDLQDIQFEVVSSGRPDGNFIRVTSRSPITEPFLTFLVEAIWQQGRLLREYTVLLDPPTFAPPTASEPERVTAPQRPQQADSGRIDRAATPGATTRPRPEPERTQQPTPVQAPRAESTEPKPSPVSTRVPFDQASGGEMRVERGDTLWGIASAVRPDSRLTMNQTMLAIFEANPEAFGGNINLLRAGARLTIPSAEEIYRIDRGEALAEAKRQHSAWGSRSGAAPAPSVADTETRPSLTLVPPDEEPGGVGTGDETGTGDEPQSREQEILERIAEIEAADVPVQQSLIESGTTSSRRCSASLPKFAASLTSPSPSSKRPSRTRRAPQRTNCLPTTSLPTRLPPTSRYRPTERRPMPGIPQPTRCRPAYGASRSRRWSIRRSAG